MPETWTRRRFFLAGALPLASRSALAQGSTFARKLAGIEGAIAGRLGVAVREIGTGRHYGYRADERFPLCSTFKVLACAAVLKRVDGGQEDLNRRIRFGPGDLVTYSPVTKDHVGGDGMTLGALCTAAMTQSDNTAGNLILASLGGPGAVTAFARSIGDQVTRLDRTEPDLNTAIPGDPHDTTTPGAMAADLGRLVTEGCLSRNSRHQLVTWLISNQTGGAKLRAGVPAGWRVGDKTGGGAWGTTNDVAVIWPPPRDPFVVCVYLTETKASFDARNATIAAVGRAVAEAGFNGPFPG
ncbi:MAG TPA: class A beta-lactamase [Acetobacteraceae bacterium]|jgi:beta-lactamase class A|nr:class A beta-lactamase [Acetobacteraceae bacterium]